MVEKLFTLNRVILYLFYLSPCLICFSLLNAPAYANFDELGSNYVIKEGFCNSQAFYPSQLESHPLKKYKALVHKQEDNNLQNYLEARRRSKNIKAKQKKIKARKRENEFLEKKKQNFPKALPYCGVKISGNYGLNNDCYINAFNNYVKMLDYKDEYFYENLVGLSCKRCLYKNDNKSLWSAVEPAISMQSGQYKASLQLKGLFGYTKNLNNGQIINQNQVSFYLDKDIYQIKLGLIEGWNNSPYYRYDIFSQLILQQGSLVNTVTWENKFNLLLDLNWVFNSSYLPKFNLNLFSEWNQVYNYYSQFGIGFGVYYDFSSGSGF